MSTATESTSTLTHIRNAAGIAQSIFTIGAIIAAGIWFFIQKEASPKANIIHEITHRQIDKDWTWIHVSISISNPGKRLLNLESGIIRIHKILPLSKDISKMLKNKKNPISEESCKVSWHRIGKEYTPMLNIKIQPGEEDNLECEFIIPSYVQTVKIYSYFAKRQRKQNSNSMIETSHLANLQNTDIGWGKETIYDIPRNIN